MTATRQIAGLIAWIALCLGAGALGGVFTAPGIESGWYALLHKPAFSPPDWVFMPVWTALYALMGIAAWLVWRRGWRLMAAALAVFVVQLAFNVGWSALFFWLRLPGAALVELLALWGLVAWVTAAFWRCERAAGALLVPYLGWLTFAGALNFELWRLNR